jgi:aspartyl protease family protein
METTPNPHRTSGTVMLAIAWLLLFGGAYWAFEQWYQVQENPNPQSVLLAQQGPEVVLLRNGAGSYVAEGEINGRKVIFLLDTGASQVALSSALAQSMGLRRGATVKVQTANGLTLGYQTRLARVQLGPIEVRDVSALVTDGIKGEDVLLGMSFLKQLEFTQRDNQLTIKPLRSPNI